MKNLTILIAMLIAIGGCSKEVPSDQLVERGGLKYEVNSQTPFTGSSVEYYLDTIIKNQYEERVLKTRITFKDGVTEGLKESFHLNGQLKTKGNFKEGKKDGLWEENKENGQLIYIKKFKNGELKKTELYDEKGNEVIFDISKRWKIKIEGYGEEDAFLITFTPEGNLIINEELILNSYWELLDNGKITISVNDGYLIMEGYVISYNKIGGFISEIKYGEKKGESGTWSGRVYDEN